MTASLVRNQVNQSVFFNLTDAAGEPVTGVAFGAVTLKYKVGDTGAVTTLTPVSMANHEAVWVSDGWSEVANGLYRYCVRNAVISDAGADYAHFWLNCAGLGARWVHLQAEIVDQLQVDENNQAEAVVTGWGPDALASMLDGVDVESGYSLREVLTLITAANVGKLTGPAVGDSGTVVIRDINDTKDRISMPVDAAGRRIGPATYDGA